MRNYLFLGILGLSTLFIAGCAAFFSIVGLSHLFAGAFWSVVIMASSLEIGKLITASFIYRYWEKIKLWMKGYLLSGMIILMLITSIGIFGFLSKAYQGSTLDLQQLSTQLKVFEEQKENFEEEKVYLKQEMNQQLADLPENYVTAKRNIRNTYTKQIAELSSKIMELSAGIGDIKLQLVDTGVDVGPILYVAKAVDTDVDTAVKWLIILLIVVFDPLAVCLTVAFNIVLLDKNNKPILRNKIESKIVRVPLADRGKVLPPTSVGSPKPSKSEPKKAPIKSSRPLSGRF